MFFLFSDTITSHSFFQSASCFSTRLILKAFHLRVFFLETFTFCHFFIENVSAQFLLLSGSLSSLLKGKDNINSFIIHAGHFPLLLNIFLSSRSPNFYLFIHFQIFQPFHIIFFNTIDRLLLFFLLSYFNLYIINCE